MSERVTVDRDGHVLMIGPHVSAGLDLAEAGPAVAERAAVEHLHGVLGGILSSDDAAEGVRSFLERRTARFSGR